MKHKAEPWYEHYKTPQSAVASIPKPENAWNNSEAREKGDRGSSVSRSRSGIAKREQNSNSEAAKKIRYSSKVRENSIAGLWGGGRNTAI